MSHKELILAELEKGRMLSKLDILSEFGCLNGGGRISDLRRDGNKINYIMVKKNGNQFARYYLVAQDIRRVF